jgi:hypothetical protein
MPRFVDWLQNKTTGAESGAEWDVCAICQNGITVQTDGADAWTTHCNHRFHTTCLVQQLLVDPRCPCCRKVDPGYVSHEYLHDELDEPLSDSSDIVSISFEAAMKNAFSQAKKDKGLARQVKTLHKWGAIRKDARRDAARFASQLRPLEDKLAAEIETHNNKRWDIFDAKNAKLIASHQEASALASKANSQHRLAKFRLARKGGWTPY